ncbi:hypothetical protein CVT26_007450 [Gymnopilus dilepis]|uniref:Uncharacterized protein n=1 Tax=Gymnopilus dilepis TaxID=231916 RepID=A0A409X2N1_9AGAR|nr:hypothetical protein CVT26_007450 [Gymnopilus dilepis]
MSSLPAVATDMLISAVVVRVGADTDVEAVADVSLAGGRLAPPTCSPTGVEARLEGDAVGHDHSIVEGEELVGVGEQNGLTASDVIADTNVEVDDGGMH